MEVVWNEGIGRKGRAGEGVQVAVAVGIGISIIGSLHALIDVTIAVFIDAVA